MNCGALCASTEQAGTTSSWLDTFMFSPLTRFMLYCFHFFFCALEMLYMQQREWWLFAPIANELNMTWKPNFIALTIWHIRNANLERNKEIYSQCADAVCSTVHSYKQIVVVSDVRSTAISYTVRRTLRIIIIIGKVICIAKWNEWKRCITMSCIATAPNNSKNFVLTLCNMR